jgi:hypothetical protein
LARIKVFQHQTEYQEEKDLLIIKINRTMFWGPGSSQSFDEIHPGIFKVYTGNNSKNIKEIWVFDFSKKRNMLSEILKDEFDLSDVTL